MGLPAIEFHDVSLSYRAPDDRGVHSLKEWVICRIRSRPVWKELRALDDVSFTVEKGTAVGIIGPNGAGKSTLLRIAGGILTPSRGEAIIRGSLAPIIELGTGFELELSGRENILFNGALLGHSRATMLGLMDGIVDFSGLGDFIDAPLRTYSSGMVMRLAFSIATTVNAHILLLDEILAVGDGAFIKKCLDRIDSYRDRGITILLASHNLYAVETLCDLALWLDRGRVKAWGPAGEVVQRYVATQDPTRLIRDPGEEPVPGLPG